MSDKVNYLECWIAVATSLLGQALAGEPSLTESLPKPMQAGCFGFAATITGEEEGRFSVLLEASLVDATLLGDRVDQKAGWSELLKEVAEAAAGELLAKTGRKCQVSSFIPIEGESKMSRAFQLSTEAQNWSLHIYSSVKLAKAAQTGTDTLAGSDNEGERPFDSRTKRGASIESDVSASAQERLRALSPGLQILLDVELEASLRFGAREMPLSEILDLGPGDVVQLDRHISDPVDLIVGDKIVARGDVVLINGNFGLRVTQVAQPELRLETIRCLF